MACIKWYGSKSFDSHLADNPIEFEFFQHLNQFYGVIAEVCTNRNCPRYRAPLYHTTNHSMSAGPGY